IRKVLARAGPARVFVHDRLDVALATGCHGVHLGASTLPVAEIRRMAPSLLIGYSAHGCDEALRAERDGASFVTFSPIYETQSKGAGSAQPPQGIEKLAAVCGALRIPVYALGGITRLNAAEALRAGAAGVAVVSAITEAEDVESASRRLVECVEKTRAEKEERRP
ncbi:MAG: thiamine phosphate synthase, partial [Myxococcota bacterium]